MENKKVGFYKRVQGVFTQDLINSIEARLEALPGVELITGLDYKKSYVLNGDVYIGDLKMNGLDLYFWHDSVQPMKWGADNYFVNTLERLEGQCEFVNSPTSVRIVNDKYLAHSVLKKADLPVADFALVSSDNKEKLELVFNSLGGQVVVKPRHGGWGIGVDRIKTLDELMAIADKLEESKDETDKQIFMERFYEHDNTKWIAVVVFGGKVLFGYRKELSGKDDWKVYDPDKKDGRGDFSDYVIPPDGLQEIALKASEAIGKDIIGFDCIYTEDGYKIVDENGRPGLYKHCLEKADINIDDEVIELISSKLDVLE